MKVVDMHCDTVLNLVEALNNHQEVNLYRNNGHLDLEKMQKGDYLLQNFALFLDLKEDHDPLEHCLLMLDTICQEISKNDQMIGLVKAYKDIEENKKAGRMSAMLTIEEGGAIKGSLANLRNFYRLGVRMMTLTWNYPNEIGYPNCRTPEGVHVFYRTPNTTNGLTKFGFETIAEMEKLGMIIDVSHMSDAGFYDVLHNTTKPFVASHSNARAICPHVRNLSDDMIRSIAERGGVMGLNYEASFLREVTENMQPVSKLEDMIKHAKHIVNVGGIACLGLGSDFDGIGTSDDLKNASYLPHLADAFSKEGFTDSQIEAIFSQNVLNVYREIL